MLNSVMLKIVKTARVWVGGALLSGLERGSNICLYVLF